MKKAIIFALVTLAASSVLGCSQEVVSEEPTGETSQELSLLAPPWPWLKLRGKTAGEWSAEWWKWADQGYVDGTDPIADTTGELCAVNQGNKVFFLAGTWGGNVTRNCTVRYGTPLFFPIMNSQIGYDPDVAPNEEYGKDSQKARIAELTESVEDMYLRIDGVTLTKNQLLAYRATAEDFDTAYGGPLLSDGYWVWLYILTPGLHTIEFGGTNPTFQTGVTYNLRVCLTNACMAAHPNGQ